MEEVRRERDGAEELTVTVDATIEGQVRTRTIPGLFTATILEARAAENLLRRLGFEVEIKVR